MCVCVCVVNCCGCDCAAAAFVLSPRYCVRLCMLVRLRARVPADVAVHESWFPSGVRAGQQQEAGGDASGDDDNDE